jgi:hypothetical protein
MEFHSPALCSSVSLPSAMKKALLAVPFLLTALIAHADLVVEQKIESAMVNGNTVTKIKGDQIKIDSPVPGGGNYTTIVNAQTGDATTLMHAQKMGMKMNINAIQKQMQAVTGGNAANPANMSKPKATGQKEKVGEYDADVYEMSVMGQNIKMWAAKDYPHAQKLKEQMNKLAKATSGGMMDPSHFDVPGMIVKTEMTTPQGKVTQTLTSVREENVAATEFEIPTGYNIQEMPQIPGNK